MYCEINKYSHHFTVSKIWPDISPHILSFISKNLVQTKLEKRGRRFIPVPDKLYCTRSDAGKVYRFHINHLEMFLQYLQKQRVSLDFIKIKNHKPPKPLEVDYKVKEMWVPREKQIPIIDYITDEGNIKVITLQMGQGKTFSSLYSAAQNGTKLLVQVLARYTEKWESDLTKTYDIDKSKIKVIRGMKALFKFMMKFEDQPHRNDFDVFVISTDTLIAYIKDYEKNHHLKRESWYIKPQDLYKKLGIGQKIIDEVHQRFHWNFKIELYTNIEKVIYLSATLDDLDDQISIKMYEILLPKKYRRDGGVVEVYTDVISFNYEIDSTMKPIKHKGDKGQYSHIAFENSILKNDYLKKQYFEMIYYLINTFYFKIKRDGQKCLNFFSLTDMCEQVRDYLKEKFKILEINKYTSEDDLEVFDESDIINSTLGSSGTAIDVPDLVTCIKTVALSKSQANLQAFGRLRDLKDRTDANPHFVYLVCTNIPKHVEYSKKKKFLLRTRAKTVNDEYYHKVLKTVA